MRGGFYTLQDRRPKMRSILDDTEDRPVEKRSFSTDENDTIEKIESGK
jgi:hypothetical protein